jgi:hypothetical protein
MEAIMPNSITQLVVGTAVALAMTVASVGVIGGTVAQSSVEHGQLLAHESLMNRYTSPVSETEDPMLGAR